MDKKRIAIIFFILMSLAQLFVPAKMIMDKEKVLELGVEYKFLTAPVDPTDPFRGKYITLRYSENSFEVENEKDWSRGEPVYICLTTDEAGFAKIASVLKNKPIDNQDFFMGKIKYHVGNNLNKLLIEFPFDRYYMEESKAYGAEKMYRENRNDVGKTTYALVSVMDGKAILKDVIIGDRSIRELVKSKQEEIIQ